MHDTFGGKITSNGESKPETQFGSESRENPKMSSSLSSTQISTGAAQTFRREGKKRSHVRSSESPLLLILAATCARWSSHFSRQLASCLLIRASDCAVQSPVLAATIGKTSSAARSALSFAGMDIAPTPADPPLEVTFAGAGVRPH